MFKQLSRLISFAVFCCSASAYSADFVVESGQTVFVTQTLSDDGDQGLIEEGGAIETVGNGVNMFNSNQVVLNQGDISTTGFFARGIFSTGANADITNSGSISTLGDFSHGIHSTGVSAEITNSGSISTQGSTAAGISSTGVSVSITNSGSISTQGSTAHGIFSSGADAIITNSGSISTQGDFAAGISSEGANAVIINSGSISTQGNIAPGIFSTGDNAVITNSGSISTQGSSSHGIFSSGADAIITNSGSISTQGVTAHGIFITGDNAVITNSGVISATGADADGIRIFEANNSHIINSGTVISTNGHAIHIINSSNPTLTLQQGSNIQGSVRSESALNLNVGSGLNLFLTLTDDSEGFGQLNISSPFVLLNSNTIAVVDNTLFAIQEDMTHDMSDSILGGVYHSCCPSPCGCGFWTRTIGSYRKRSETDYATKYSDWQLGQMIGYDKIFRGATVGIFGGYLHGEGKTSDPLDKIYQNTYFGGLSLTKNICNACVGLTFAAGYVDWDEKLEFMDNLSVGGVDVYTSDNSGTFITSELSVMKQFCMTCFDPRLTFYVRHVGLYLGDYSQEGTDFSIAIKGRDIDLLTTRLDVGFPTGVDCYCLEPFIGIYGRYKLRGSHVELEGNTTSFDVGLRDHLVAGVIGVRGSQCVCNKEVTFSVSGDFDNEKSSRVLGSLGIYF